MNLDIKIYQLNENLLVDKYLNDQVQLMLNRLINIGHSKEVALSVISFDRDDRDLRIMIAEVDSKFVGLICYSADDSLVTINLAVADTDDYKKVLYENLESVYKNLGCLYMKERLSLKDVESIEMLKNIGFTQECVCLFKRV